MQVHDAAGNPQYINASTVKMLYGEAPGNPDNANPGVGQGRTFMQYDGLGRLLRQESQTSEYRLISTVSYVPTDVTTDVAGLGSNGYDAAGNPVQYTVFNGEGDSFSKSTFRMDYLWRDGALLATTTGDRANAPRPGVTLKTYDGNGHIRSVIDPSDGNSDQTRFFNTDANGTVLRSVQIGRDSQGRLLNTITNVVNNSVTQASGVQQQPGLSNEQFQLVAAGQVLGRYGEMVNPDGPRNKDNKLQFIEDSDFNFVYKSVNDGAAQGTSTYTVAKGDTLQSIARSQLGDADLWFTIAQANGLADSAELEVGQVLRIPAVVVTSTNNDDGTFEAYDPTAIIGDTTPVIPQPPKKKSNPLKMILIIVAAVVITIFTAGALSGVATGFAQTSN